MKDIKNKNQYTDLLPSHYYVISFLFLIKFLWFYFQMSPLLNLTSLLLEWPAQDQLVSLMDGMITNHIWKEPPFVILLYNLCSYLPLDHVLQH